MPNCNEVKFRKQTENPLRKARLQELAVSIPSYLSIYQAARGKFHFEYISSAVGRFAELENDIENFQLCLDQIIHDWTHVEEQNCCHARSL